ncbi:hypothetical protein AGLY_005174 [Aphis glycines]|uniref:Uncharacterized protein n=1 Tax=Aphis glycines TaxID=307491 RepID=A0A6G0TW14_APHGL|nr:hypothetical protein AGLY_005174 [Aphis glycines]
MKSFISECIKPHDFVMKLRFILLNTIVFIHLGNNNILFVSPMAHRNNRVCTMQLKYSIVVRRNFFITKFHKLVKKKKVELYKFGSDLAMVLKMNLLKGTAVFFDTTLLRGIPGVEQNKPRFTLKCVPITHYISLQYIKELKKNYGLNKLPYLKLLLIDNLMPQLHHQHML